ncbi:putative Ig domain-containing protein, partial [Arenimonas caeni]
MLLSRSAAGVEMNYSYDAFGNKVLERTGLNHQMTWEFDVHGRAIDHKDLGGRDYNYSYQANGQLSTETSSSLGLTRSVTYYANGLVKRVQLSAGEFTEYEYDAAGNRTYERNYNAALEVDVVTRVSYDSHNRVSRVTSDDMWANGQRFLDLEYAYDAVGNRRRVVAHSGYGPGVTPIVAANSAPIRTANPASVNLKVGQATEWRWHPADYFSDPEGQDLGFTVTQGATGALPAWLNYRRDEVTGEWVFTYSGSGTAGQSASIQIKATDPSGATAVATFTASLKTGNTAPVVIGSGSLSYLIKTGQPFGQEYLLSELFRDADIGDQLSLSLVGQVPAWLSVVSTGDAVLVNGTPGSGHVGASSFKLRATDLSGATRDITVSLDVKAPVAPTAFAVPNATAYAGSSFTFERDLSLVFTDVNGDDFTVEADRPGGSALPYWLDVAIEGEGAAARLVVNSNGVPSNLAHNSSITVRFTATDSDGMSSSTTLTIDIVNLALNQAPVYTSGTVSNQFLVAGSPWSYTIPTNAFVDPEGSPVSLSAVKVTWVEEPSPGPGEPGFSYWQVDPLPSWLTFNPTTRTFSGTAPSEQEFSVRIRAADEYNKFVDRMFLVSVGPNQAPYVSSPIADKVVQAGNNWSYTVPSGTFTDPNGQTLTYSASGMPSGMTFNAGTRKFTYNNAASGTYSITVTANDGAGGTASDTFILTVNVAPTVANPIPNRSGHSGVAWSYTVPSNTFQDGNNHSLTYSASGMPSGMTFNASTRTFNYASPVSGTYNITVTASDGYGGSVSDTFTLTVTTPPNSPPVVASPIPDQTVQRSQTWYFAFYAGTFSDPNGHTLTYTASGMPFGMAFNSATRSFIYDAPYVTANRSHTITVTANDGHGGTVSDSFVLTILASGGGGGGGGGGPGGPLDPQSQPLITSRNSIFEQAASTDESMAMSLMEPEMVQTTSMSSTGGLNREEAWFTYDAENRVKIVNGKLENGQILTEAPRLGRPSYLVQYDALGREIAQISQGDFGQTIHSQTYTERGERLRSSYATTANAYAVSTVNHYDEAGRLTKSVGYFPPGQTLAVKDGEGMIVGVDIGGLLAEATLYTYDADGRVVSQQTLGRRANATPAPLQDPAADQRFQWVQIIAPNGFVADPVKQSTDLSVLTLLEGVHYTTAGGASGYDAAGRLTTYRYIKHAPTWVGSSGYSSQANQTFTHTYTFTYQNRTGYLEASITGTSSNSSFKTTTSTSTYDAAGRRSQVVDKTPIPDTDDLESRRKFAYNADGQIIRRQDHYKDDGQWVQGKDEGANKLQNIAPRLISQADWDALTKAEREAWYDKRDNHLMTYVSGQLVATQDQAGKLDVLGQLTGFSNTSLGRSQVQVQQGDTLKSIAARVYGNDQLWYVLADANGLGGDDALVAGSTLTVPEVKTSLNDASTFKPYDPGEITGPTTPSLPYIPPPDQGCGAIGQIIMVVVTIVVTVYTAGLGTAGITAAGNTFGQIMAAGIGSMGSSMGLAAASAFVGSVAGQAIGSGLGVASFSWRSAASSGLAAGLTAGLGKLELLSKITGKLGAFGETAFGQGVVSGISSNLVRQATDRIAGVDTSFSWKSVAISAVSAGIGSTVAGAVGSRLNLETETGQMVKDFVGGAAGGLVSHHLRRQVGLDKGANYGMVLADAFGTMLANRMTTQHKIAADNEVADRELREEIARYFEASDGYLIATAPARDMSLEEDHSWRAFEGVNHNWGIPGADPQPAGVDGLLAKESALLEEVVAFLDESIADARHIKPAHDESFDRVSLAEQAFVVLGGYMQGTIDSVIGVVGLVSSGFVDYVQSGYGVHGPAGIGLWAWEKGSKAHDSLKPIIELTGAALEHEEIGPRIVDYAYQYWETLPKADKAIFGGGLIADVALTLVTGYGAAKLTERSLSVADTAIDAVDSTSKLTSFGLKLKRLFGLDQALRAVTRVETPGAEALLGQLEGIGYRATGRSKIAALAESNPGQAAALSRLINGARADEARGLVYAFERMTARGYTLVDNDFRYGGGRNHGIDMVFRSPNGGFAVDARPKLTT